MALTKIITDGITDDAVTEAKLANAINTAVAANTAKDLTALSASNLTSGTIPDARFPATLPAASAANLTAVPAANITGTLPAISGANLTGISTTPADGSITQAKLNFPVANRNLVINGAMQVAQRGTSFTPSGTEQPYTIDRFQHIGTSGIDFDSTDTQSADHPDGFAFSMKLTPDSTDTPTGSANATIQHRIEGQDMQDLAYGTSSAKQITLSFYAKSSSQNNGHQYGVELAHYATAGTRRLINASFTVTSSWQRFTFTFDGDTAQDIVNSNARGFDVNIHLASGSDDIATHTSWDTNSLFRTPTGQSNFLDNTSNEFYITGIQLERGSVATDFEHRSYGQELALCQRYCYKHDIQSNIGPYFTQYQANHKFVHDFFPVTMRAQPSHTITYNTGSPTAYYPSTNHFKAYVSSNYDAGGSTFIQSAIYTAEL